MEGFWPRGALLGGARETGRALKGAQAGERWGKQVPAAQGQHPQRPSAGPRGLWGPRWWAPSSAPGDQCAGLFSSGA